MKQLTEYDGTTTLETQPRKNMTTMGKVNTSDDDNKMIGIYVPLVI